MRAGFRLAWLQLKKERLRLLAAVAGISFSAILMLVQIGFEDALLSSAGLHFQALNCDIALVSPQYQYILSTRTFPLDRLYQALAVDTVQDISWVYYDLAPFKNINDHKERIGLLVGVKPSQDAFNLPGIRDQRALLETDDGGLFDDKARPEFGPIAQQVRTNGSTTTEVFGRRVIIRGLFHLGTSFGVDGSLVVSDANFFRLMHRPYDGQVSIGLIRLKPGADLEQSRKRIEDLLPNDVRVFTREGLVEFERKYWSAATPIGFIFQMALTMALIVGCIIVYQILYTDVTDHLSEYATLKAMGYRDRFLFGVVISEAVILSILGFAPAAPLAYMIYGIAARATLLPLNMTMQRCIMVYLLTLGMCVFSGALAMRKLRHADPAEVF
jgi:putative ABC transport system permease protein